jgi:tRNA threonylcarbamoyladenosine biosynthesis protein TsaB
MSYILHIDTSGKEGLVAIAQNGNVLAESRNEHTRDHAAAINLMVEQVLAQASITLPQIDAVAVCAGPGSYTGLRIGLATAKGYCYALDKPLLMDSKLTLLAYQAYEKIKAEPSFSGAAQVVSILVAREKEYFLSSYDINFDVTIAPVHITENELLIKLNAFSENTYITGILPDSLKEHLPANMIYIENEQVNLETWTRFAQNAYKSQNFVTLSTAEPFYLKQVFINKKQ